jgi:hypothetical protein
MEGTSWQSERRSPIIPPLLLPLLFSPVELTWTVRILDLSSVVLGPCDLTLVAGTPRSDDVT